MGSWSACGWPPLRATPPLPLLCAGPPAAPAGLHSASIVPAHWIIKRVMRQQAVTNGGNQCGIDGGADLLNCVACSTNSDLLLVDTVRSAGCSRRVPMSYRDAAPLFTVVASLNELKLVRNRIRRVMYISSTKQILKSKCRAVI